MYYILILFVIVLDQITKWFIYQSMTPGETHPILPGIFHITFVRNTGAAFSQFQGQRGLLIALTSLVLIFLVIYLIRKLHEEHWSMLLSLAFIIGGGVGNLLDRIRLGYVVDFFDFQIWPVFNVADMAVVAGCGMMIINVFWMGKHHEREQQE
ncbi:MAG: signal peptidase II [Clostridia bacterium]|jgi:signal peptidase II|nr:signal peptidase II [Clostridia bacterium]HPD89888.1 signal peptidase II [Bacillota bacterium]